MYTCDRCGTKFGARSATVESCPRCLAREGVRVRLAFRLFEETSTPGIHPGQPVGLEAAVQSRLASGALVLEDQGAGDGSEVAALEG